MQVVEIQKYSPVCIAVAVVYLALRSCGLANFPTATFWLLLCHRTLHIDLFAIRECAILVDAHSRSNTVVPYLPVDFETGDLAGSVAYSSANAALHGFPLPARASNKLHHSPITVGLTSIRYFHSATFVAAVLAEAVMAGTDPDHILKLRFTVQKIRARDSHRLGEPLQLARNFMTTSSSVAIRLSKTLEEVDLDSSN